MEQPPYDKIGAVRQNHPIVYDSGAIIPPTGEKGNRESGKTGAVQSPSPLFLHTNGIGAVGESPVPDCEKEGLP